MKSIRLAGKPVSAQLPTKGSYFFSSNRNGGVGGKDIYMAQLQVNGKWSEPLLLGSEINTRFDEESPFIHPDGKTLYFSSKGHNSIGGYDIFRCEIDLVDGKILSPVVNLGFPISDVGDDVFFVWSADNRRAYFSSDREGGFGLKDLYVAELDYHLKPEVSVIGLRTKEFQKEKRIVSSCQLRDVNTNDVQVINEQRDISLILKRGHEYELTVRSDGYCEKKTRIWTDSLSGNLDLELKPKNRKVIFTVSDSDSKPLKPKIRVVDPLQGDVFELGEDEGRDGQYHLVLKEGVKYSIEVIQKGYMLRSSTIEIPVSSCNTNFSDTTERIFDKSIQLFALEEGQTNQLDDLYYASGKVIPLLESIPQLDFFLHFMQLNTSLHAEVRAHTDEVGGVEYNLILSQKRAEYILHYLTERGINPERLSAKGMGESQPLYKGNDREELKRNRRVEFIILSK
jgi:outer membrane protein OmpA-like peptidoglycan-associated protein